MQTILAIDDEETCLEVITFSLETRGFNVITAASAKDGISILENNINVDLILLDMMLPDMYGLDALAAIKKIEFAKKIPVVMQTGAFNEADLRKSISLGAENFIIRKPYTKKDLLLAVDSALNNINLTTS
jgi:CheY-like chemotaxis protein